MGNMTLSLPWIAARAKARNCTAKITGCFKDSRRPRTPRKGLASPSSVNPRIGLSPPASTVRMVTGRSPAHRKTDS